MVKLVQMIISLGKASTLEAVTTMTHMFSRRGRIAALAALCVSFGVAIGASRADAAARL